MNEITGVAASVGFATLGITSLLVGWFALFGFVPNVLQTEDRLIPKPQKMAQAEADAIYARQKRSAEDVTEYAEVLTELGIDIGLTLRFPTETLIDEIVSKEDPNVVVGSEPTNYLRLDAGETEDDRISVRAAKRRYNLAAKSLGFDELAWREPKGWLIGRVTRTLAQKQAAEEAAKADAEKQAAEAQAASDAAQDASEDEEDESDEEDEVTPATPLVPNISVSSAPAGRRRRR
ncbi:MAG TPA: hypothetical protein VH593_29240 [Ktedonobacteraceae bacterium]|jgi:hypothetical protein